MSLGFVPFEKASENKATQDYLDIMKQYNPSGKVAALGLQAASSFLLFAKAATDCGANLTRTCLMDKAKAVTSWTGGGLHGESSPGTNTPTSCFLVMKASASGFEYDQAATAPTKGLFNCDPSNTIELKNDYGVPQGHAIATASEVPEPRDRASNGRRRGKRQRRGAPERANAP